MKTQQEAEVLVFNAKHLDSQLTSFDGAKANDGTKYS